MATDSQKLSIREKFGYSLGDCAANFVFQSQLMFLMFFYTDVFGISAATVGLLFLVSRVWDAINDPLMGAIADRTNTRWGRFRPWVLWTAVPFGVMFVLTYTTPEVTMGGRIIWAYTTYIVLMMVYTANNIPYSALTGVLTGDSIERTSLASWRFIFAMIAAFLIQGFANDIVDHLGEDNESIVHAEISGSTLTIHERNPGTAKVVIRADDGHGHEVRQSFIAKVARPQPERPSVAATLSPLTLVAGFGTHEIDLGQVFDPGKYGPLQFQVDGGDLEIVTAEVVGTRLILREHGPGTVKLSIVARDGYGSVARDQFSVSVAASGNSAPRITTQPNVELEEGFRQHRLSLADVFADQDGDSLSYTVTSSDRLVVMASIQDDVLLLSEVGPGLTQLTVTADDHRGGVLPVTIAVTVQSGENLAPAAINPLASLTEFSGFGQRKIDLDATFSDPDGDALTYRVAVVNQAKGFQYTMGLFATLAVVFFFVTFATTKERVQPDPNQKSSLVQDLIDLLRCGPWVALFVLTVFIFIYLAMRGGITLYYFTYFVGREDLFGWFNGLGLLATMIGILFSKSLAMRFGKRNTFRVCLFFTALFTALFVIVPPESIWLVFAVQILLQLSYGPTIPLLWAMMADVADYSEWMTGRRATAMAFAATVFGLKLGLSLGGALAGWLLNYYGYVPNVQQTDLALRGILLLMSVFPAVAFFLGVGALFFYRIDKRLELQIQDELTERRAQFQNV